jgi:hypothetical protein
MTIDGISENDIRSATTEDFLTLGLNVKTIYDLEQCFADSLECQTFADYFSAKLRKRISARTFSKIKTTPPVLVIYRKRFEDDLNFWCSF